MEKKIIRLIQDCWTTCNRVAMYHENNIKNLRVLKDAARVSEKNITDDLISNLPPKLLELIDQNFSSLEEMLHFFSEVNKANNAYLFINMLNKLGTFKESEFLIYGTIVAKRPFNYSSIPVTTTEYVS